MIKLEHINMDYPIGDSVCSALTDVSLTVPDGQFVSIIGRSGSGKSTLLQIASGLTVPTGGRVLYDDICISDFSKEQLAAHRNSRVGFIFQTFFLEPEYDVYTNVAVPLMIAGVPKSERDALISAQLERFEILDKSHVRTKKLSGGERQRVCIARALINRPQIIFADEPCGNLDGENAANVMRILKSLADEGKTVMLVTHDLEAAASAQRIVKLQDGRVVSDETV